MLMQHDAVVPDPVFIVKEECKAANVPKNAKKGRYKHLIGPNTSRPLSVISTEQLHKYTVMLKMKSTWVMVGSKQTIDRFEPIVRQKETIRNTNAIKELVQITQGLPYRIQSMRCTMASPLRSYKHSLSMSNFYIKISSLREREWRQTRTAFIQQIFIVGKPCARWTTGRYALLLEVGRTNCFVIRAKTACRHAMRAIRLGQQ